MAVKVLQGVSRDHIGDFPKLGVPFLGVPIIRTIVFWGLHWSPLILGNYHIGVTQRIGILPYNDLEPSEKGVCDA